MDIYFWTFIILRPILALGGFISLSKSILPLKNGWKNDNQKLITKGVTLFVFGVMSLILFIFIMNKG